MAQRYSCNRNNERFDEIESIGTSDYSMVEFDDLKMSRHLPVDLTLVKQDVVLPSMIVEIAEDGQ